MNQVINVTDRQTHSLTEKELPQEQPWSAWGFFNTWKVERISSWVKSTVDPLTNSRLSWSTTTPTPPCSNTLRAEPVWDATEHIWLSTLGKDGWTQQNNSRGLYLSSSFFSGTIENLYWNPEQPPPSTCILRYSPFSMISDSLWDKKKKKNKQDRTGLISPALKEVPPVSTGNECDRNRHWIRQSNFIL